MNLKEKAQENCHPGLINDKIVFENGLICGKYIVEQADLISTANPKMSASDMVKELKKLI